MEHLFLLTLVIFAGICLQAGLSFAFLSVASRGDRTLTLFALTCGLAAAGELLTVALLNRTTVEAFVRTDQVLAATMCVFSLVCGFFVASYSRFAPRRWLVPLVFLAGGAFLANAVLPLGIIHASASGLRSHILPWGERVSALDFEPSPWLALLLAVFTTLIAYGLRASVVQFRRGEHREAMALGVSFLLVAAAFVRDLVAWSAGPASGLLQVPLIWLGWAGMVVAMGLVMSGRLAEVTRTRKSLIESQIRYRQLVEQAADAIMVHERSTGRIVDVNRRACEMLRYPREELLAKSIPQIVAGTTREELKSTWDGLEPGNPQTVVSRYRRKDGSTYPVEVSVGLVGPRLDLVLGLSRDLSEREKADAERHQLETQVQLAQRMDALGTLAGGVAHDFNNILGAVVGYLELAMQEGVDPEDRSSYLEQIRTAAFRARDLVQRILAFSRPSQQEARPIRVDEILREALRLLRATLPANIEFRIHLRAEVQICADPSQIHQLILNLCTNAGHAMEETGGVLTVDLDELEVSTQLAASLPELSPGPHVKLTVRDTGTGMEPRVLERVFDPFFTTKPSDKGNGLGLSVVHGIVKHHQGAIRAESLLGEGSTFTVILPRLTTEAIEPEVLRPQVPTGSGNILVVDDDSAIADVLTRMLQGLGYAASTFTRAEDALLAFRRAPQDVDLVITDMAMPGLTGDQLAVRILEDRPDLPIILCTGYSARLDEDAARALGIRAFLRKPLRRDTLATSVHDLLGSPLQRASSA